MSMLGKLKQFRDLRTQAKTLQNALSGESVSVSEAGGKLKMTMDGNLRVTSVELDPNWLAPGNKKDIEKAVQNAADECIKKVQRIMASKMKDMGGFKMPGME